MSMLELSYRQKRRILTGTMLALFLGALEQTVVATAGPAIQRALAIPASLYLWITTAYLVASMAMVPVYGKLSDQLGRRPVLLTGLGLFMAGSLLCGLATSTTFLIASRTVQGLGAASIFATAFSVIADLYPPHQRAKYQGLYSAVFGIASVLGPVAGGLIADHLGWPWVFFLNLPLGLCAIAVIAARMPSTRPNVTARGPIDLLGAFLLLLGIAPLLLALTLGRSEHIPGEPGFLWTSNLIRGLFALAAVGACAFVVTERRARDPIIDFSFYGHRVFGPTTLASLLLGASFIPGLIVLPLFMVRVVGISSAKAGATLIPLSLSIAIGSAISGRIGVKLGRTKPLLIASLALLGAGLGLLGVGLAPGVAQGSVALRLILVGVGLGGTLPMFNIAVQNSVPRERLGVATSAISFARSLGQVLGLTLVGVLFAATLRAPAATTPERLTVFAAAIRSIYQGSAGFALLSLVITLATPDVLYGHRRAREPVDAA